MRVSLLFFFAVHISILVFSHDFLSVKYGCDVPAMEENLHYNDVWKNGGKPHLFIQPLFALSAPSVKSSNILSSFVFTSAVGAGYAHLDHELHNMPETVEHRILRGRKAKDIGATEFPFTARPAQTVKCLWTDMPHLLCLSILRVSSFLRSTLVDGLYWTVPFLGDLPRLSCFV